MDFEVSIPMKCIKEWNKLELITICIIIAIQKKVEIDFKFQFIVLFTTILIRISKIIWKKNINSNFL
jgi:hypothetical protein